MERPGYVRSGTRIAVVLSNQSGPWTIPQSSDPKALPRLTMSSRCVTPITATFEADGPGRIDANRANGEMTQVFEVSIALSS